MCGSLTYSKLSTKKKSLSDIDRFEMETGHRESILMLIWQMSLYYLQKILT